MCAEIPILRVLEMIFSAAGVMSVSYEVEKILTNYFDMITIYFQVKPLHEGKEKLFMDGQKVFKFSLREVPIVFNELLEKADLEKDDIDLFIFHQASAVILRQLKLKLNIPDEKWFQNIKNMGNTVSATIPIAIKQSIDSGLYKPNMKIMLMGFGVGLSVAGCIIRS